MLQEADGFSTWKFVYGMQNPMVVCLTRLYELPASEPIMRDASLDDMIGNSWDFTFYEDLSNFVYSDDGHFRPEQACWVLPGLCYRRGNHLVADGRWLTLAEVLLMFPTLPANPPAKEVKEESAFEEDIFSRNPWLEDYIKFGEDGRDRGKASLGL